ncbi:hypothetical protein ATN84_17175 [Paramesorhizobium deserti]|uniref:EF-hand domain-containing protein n=1 Tax=Paramesorhizobium deserti TaxID=1494590 RepID=A0A135HRY8_9HYPH|nr:EF-hand domain-containing protein [Paramesorhizobium deserti]KXF75961.1 hypothetical protein ATN84_17175 [Paramesorhizobium deserti]
MYIKYGSALPAALVFTAGVIAGTSVGTAAQADTPHEQHHTVLAQTAPAPSTDPATPQDGQPPYSGMMGQRGPGMMMGQGGPNMMGPNMMGGGMMPGMMGGMPMRPMRPLVMKIFFAIADTNGDGALSFDEVSAIHKRIFDSIDADKNGAVTPDEIKQFMQE